MLNGTIDNTEITARFGKGTVSESSGCNSYNAAYLLDSDRITISRPALTQMMCAEEIMTQETRYLTAVAGAESYDAAGNQLRIDGLETMVFSSR